MAVTVFEAIRDWEQNGFIDEQALNVTNSIEYE